MSDDVNANPGHVTEARARYAMEHVGDRDAPFDANAASRNFEKNGDVGG